MENSPQVFMQCSLFGFWFGYCLLSFKSFVLCRQHKETTRIFVLILGKKKCISCIGLPVNTDLWSKACTGQTAATPSTFYFPCFFFSESKSLLLTGMLDWV